MFLLPFAEVKCGGSSLAKKSGFDICTGNDWKVAGGMFDKYGFDKKEKATEKEGNTQIFAIVGLALGVIGLLLSFSNARNGWNAGMVSGALAAAALIGLMIDMKRWFNNSVDKSTLNKTSDQMDDFGLGSTMNNLKPTLEFTPWFYLAVIAFLVAAFFCYKRMQATK